MPRQTRNQAISVQELWRGRSSQPPWKQLPGMVEQSLNSIFDVASGAHKRFPTELKAKLIESRYANLSGVNVPDGDGGEPLDPDGSWHWLNIRDAIIAIGFDSVSTSGGPDLARICAWDFDGNPIPVFDASLDTDPPMPDDTFPEDDDPVFGTTTLMTNVEGTVGRWMQLGGGDVDFADGKFRSTVNADTAMVTNINANGAGARVGWSFLQSCRYMLRGYEGVDALVGGTAIDGDTDGENFLGLDLTAYTRVTAVNEIRGLQYDSEMWGGEPPDYSGTADWEAGPEFASLEDALLFPPIALDSGGLNLSNRFYVVGDVIRLTIDSELNPAGYYMFFDGGESLVSGDILRPLPTGLPYPFRQVVDGSPGDSPAPRSRILNTADGLFERHTGNFYRVPRGFTGVINSGGSLSQEWQGQSGDRLYRYPIRIIYDTSGSIPRVAGEDDDTPLNPGDQVFGEKKIMVSKGPWKLRVSGNNATNPPPEGGSWVDLKFFEDRLCLYRSTTLYGSRQGDYFNQFLWNVDQPTDRDRFTVGLGFNNIGGAVRMGECGRRLLLLAEAGQVEFGSGEEPLTAFNGKARVLTRFQTTSGQPGEGPGVCTIVDKYNDVHQYRYLNERDGVVYGSHLNAHDKDNWHLLHPRNIYQLGRTSYVIGRDILDIPDRPYDTLTQVHETLILGGQEVQTAWGGYNTQGVITFVSEWNDRHRWVTLTDVGYTLAHHIHKEIQPAEDLVFWPSIDLYERVIETEIEYDPALNITFFTHTGRDGTEDSRIIRVDSGHVHEVLSPEYIDTDGRVAVRGNQIPESGEPMPYMGFGYEWRIDLTPLWVGLSASVVLIPRLFVFHEDSTDYEVLIRRDDGVEKFSRWQADSTGVTVLGVPKDSTFFSEHSPAGDARRLRLAIRNRGSGRATINGLYAEADIGQSIGV